MPSQLIKKRTIPEDSLQLILTGTLFFFVFWLAFSAIQDGRFVPYDLYHHSSHANRCNASGTSITLLGRPDLRTSNLPPLLWCTAICNTPCRCAYQYCHLILNRSQSFAFNHCFQGPTHQNRHVTHRNFPENQCPSLSSTLCHNHLPITNLSTPHWFTPFVL